MISSQRRVQKYFCSAAAIDIRQKIGKPAKQREALALNH
jgi:hypothetical protein